MTPASLSPTPRRLVGEALVVGRERDRGRRPSSPRPAQRGDGRLGERPAVGVVEVADGDRRRARCARRSWAMATTCSESLGTVRKNSSRSGKSSRASAVAVGEHVRTPARQQVVERRQGDRRRRRTDDGVDAPVEQRVDARRGRRRRWRPRRRRRARPVRPRTPPAALICCDRPLDGVDHRLADRRARRRTAGSSSADAQHAVVEPRPARWSWSSDGARWSSAPPSPSSLHAGGDQRRATAARRRRRPPRVHRIAASRSARHHDTAGAGCPYPVADGTGHDASTVAARDELDRRPGARRARAVPGARRTRPTSCSSALSTTPCAGRRPARQGRGRPRGGRRLRARRAGAAQRPRPAARPRRASAPASTSSRPRSGTRCGTPASSSATPCARSTTSSRSPTTTSTRRRRCCPRGRSPATPSCGDRLVDRGAGAAGAATAGAGSTPLRSGASSAGTQAGEVAYLLEPDLKDGHGGLRDVQSLWWAARRRPASCRPTTWPRSTRATPRCVDARVALHRATGRPGDVLRLEDQDAVAARLGHGHADALMADVAAAGRTIAWIADEAWRHVSRHPLGHEERVGAGRRRSSTARSS